MAPVDVSVVVPTYNGADHVGACLESILDQDLDGVEVLVVDDRSTDGTREVVAGYQHRFPDFRLVAGEARLGAVANVNRCVEMARGRWVKPVFQDDLIDPGCLTTMRAARQPGVPVVVCARRYLYEEGVPDFRREACEHLVEHALPRRFGSRLLAADEMADVVVEQTGGRYPHVNLVGEPVAVMFERRALVRSGGFDDGFVQLWDYEAVLRLAVADGMVLVDEPLATFRVHEGSETARNFTESAFRINVVDRLRLYVLYATDMRFRAVRRAAARAEPPVDVMGTAVGGARAAAVLLDCFPESEREAARLHLDALALRLPEAFPAGSPADVLATDVEATLVRELLDGPWLGLSAAAPDAAALDELAGPATPGPPDLAPDQSTEPADAGDAGDDGGGDGDPPEAAPEPTADGPAPRRARLPRPLRVLYRATRALRAHQWWAHMLGPVVAMALLQAGWRDAAPGAAITRLVALLASAVALAGYGYVVNDAADVEPDRLAGKTNAMARFSPRVRVAVIGVFAAAGAVPWAFVSLDRRAAAALAVIYLLPLLYSTRPVRLKERPVLGPIADASNAFAVPALFSIALYAPLGDSRGPEALMVVGALCWTYGLGLRAILLHHVDDAAYDRSSGTYTLVTHIGERRVVRLQRAVCFPLEMVGFALLLATVATWAWVTVVVGLAVVGGFQLARATGVVHRELFVSRIEQGLVMYWYQIWPALALSVSLAVHDPWYLVTTGLVVVLFWPRVRSALGVGRRVVAGEVHRRRHPA